MFPVLLNKFVFTFKVKSTYNESTKRILIALNTIHGRETLILMNAELL